MFKRIVGILTLVLFSSVGMAQSRYLEGSDYFVVAKQKTQKPVITEVFSFYCPVCYRVEAIAKSVKASLPPGVQFDKSHVDFMHGATPEQQHKLTIALVVARKLNVEEKVNAAIFDAIHKKRQRFTTDEQIKQLFIDNGVSAQSFDKLYNSFAIKGEANKQRKLQQSLSRSNNLGGVPAFIVNGKYKINREKLASIEDYNNIIQYLLSLD